VIAPGGEEAADGRWSAEEGLADARLRVESAALGCLLLAIIILQVQQLKFGFVQHTVVPEAITKT
jgi:hypothetical protein